MPRGGARPGAGAKKGTQHKATIDKAAAREALRAVVIKHMGAMLAAQISNATGLKYLVVRQKSSGKFLRVAENAAAKLNPDEETIEIWEKDPSVQAFTDLMNRAIDKPIEQVEMNVSGEITTVSARLIAARKRFSERLKRDV